MNTELIIRSILLGIGLAMDAFSVSIADGLSEQNMRGSKKLAIAGTFAVFQFAMPLIGWVLVKTAVEAFGFLEVFIPWIALLLLLYIGGKMLYEGIRESREGSQEESAVSRITFGTLVVQGIATSIDALSVGFTIEEYGLSAALGSSVIIGLVTLVICIAGVDAGRMIGTKLSGKASMVGGIILILIGLEIWAKGVLF